MRTWSSVFGWSYYSARSGCWVHARGKREPAGHQDCGAVNKRGVQVGCDCLEQFSPICRLARLKGISTVCKLQCSCNPSTSVLYLDKEILYYIVRGLADARWLGVLEKMDLYCTVQQVEAKESGKKAGAYLDNGERGGRAQQDAGVQTVFGG